MMNLLDPWYKKLLYWGFCSNYWGWFHTIAGGLIGKIVNIWLADLWSILVVFAGAFIWEFIEFFIECGGSWKEVIKIYGSKERWLYDSLGDIILAVLCSILVVL